MYEYCFQHNITFHFLTFFLNNMAELDGFVLDVLYVPQITTYCTLPSIDGFWYWNAMSLPSGGCAENYKRYVARETAIYDNPNDSSNCDSFHSRITRQLGYQNTICQNAVSKKLLFVLIFSLNNNMQCWSIEDRSSFFPLAYNCVPVDYKLLFQERHVLTPISAL
jgi:hypothetical protein